MMQMLELLDKAFKAAIIHMLHEVTGLKRVEGQKFSVKK